MANKNNVNGNIVDLYSRVKVEARKAVILAKRRRWWHGTRQRDPRHSRWM